MNKLSQLNQPKEATMSFRGEPIKFKYISQVLDKDYIDEYDEFTKKFEDPEILGSQKMPLMRAHALRRVTWIDLQDDDDKDIPVEEALKYFAYDELVNIEQFVKVDILRRFQEAQPLTGSVSN